MSFFITFAVMYIYYNFFDVKVNIIFDTVQKRKEKFPLICSLA